MHWLHFETKKDIQKFACVNTAQTTNTEIKMKNFVLSFFAATMVSSFAFADVITCSFTEPWVTTTYSMAQQSLTISAFDGNNETIQIVKNVSFQIKGPRKFELVKDGKVLQKITLDNKGNDGMSDILYPYSVEAFNMKKYANSGFGGCSSNYLKSKEEGDGGY
jgi:hypothetical protein